MKRYAYETNVTNRKRHDYLIELSSKSIGEFEEFKESFNRYIIVIMN